MEPADLLKDVLGLKPTHALLTTYSLDLAFFETEIFNRLQDKSPDIDLVLLADQATYREIATAGRFVRKAESEYRFIPVNHPCGVFHPKVFLFMGSDWARVYVGSANLTSTGFGRNLEIVDRIDFDIDDPASVATFKGLGGFLAGICSRLSVPRRAHAPIDRIRSILEARIKGRPPSEGLFAVNERKSLFDVLVDCVPKDCREIIVVSPYHDPKNSPFRELAGAFPKATIKIVVSPEGSHYKPLADAGLKARSKLLSFGGGAQSSRHLHAKVILAKWGGGSVLVVGSANFTRSGFLLNWEQGNVEAWTLRKGGASTFDALFAGDFKLVDAPKDLPYVPMSVEPAPVSPGIGVEYASFSDDGMRLDIDLGKVPPGQISQPRVIVEGLYGKLVKSVKTLALGPLAVSVGLSEIDVFGAPCCLRVECLEGDKLVRSNPVWVELSYLLSLTSRDRRLRSALSDLECAIERDGGVYDGKGVAKIYGELGRLLRELAEKSDEGCDDDEMSSPENGAEGKMRPVGGSRGGGDGNIASLTAALRALRNIVNKDPEVLRKKRAASAQTGSDEADDADNVENKSEFWTPDELFIRNFDNHLGEVLDCVSELDPADPRRLRWGISALECFFLLSFIIDVQLVTDVAIDGMSGGGSNRLDTHWRRIVKFALLEDETEGDPRGWLARIPEGKGLDFSRWSLFFAGLLALVCKWTIDAKGYPARISRLRDQLAVLQKCLFDGKEVDLANFRASLEKLTQRIGAHSEEFPTVEVIDATLKELASRPTQRQHVDDFLGAIHELASLDASIPLLDDLDRKACIDKKSELLALLEKDARYDRFLKAYSSVSARFFGRNRPALAIINPETNRSCPLCKDALPMGVRTALASPTKMNRCPGCDGILFGAGRFFEDRNV
ncbi:MAG: hypothetical protein ABIK28_18820 [Planctomycetota bacterium]